MTGQQDQRRLDIGDVQRPLHRGRQEKNGQTVDKRPRNTRFIGRSTPRTLQALVLVLLTFRPCRFLRMFASAFGLTWIQMTRSGTYFQRTF